MTLLLDTNAMEMIVYDVWLIIMKISSFQHAMTFQCDLQIPGIRIYPKASP